MHNVIRKNVRFGTLARQKHLISISKCIVSIMLTLFNFLAREHLHTYTTNTSSTARGGAEVALGIYYKTFFIYRICMRRAPARPVRACFVQSCCTDVVYEHDLRTTPAQCNAKQTLSSHFTLHSSHFTLALHTCTSHSLLASSQLFSSHRISSHMSSK